MESLYTILLHIHIPLLFSFSNRLINKLRKHAGMSTVKVGGQNNLTAFIALENIAKFNKAAQEYGVTESALFQSVDLYECHKGPFLNVINCLNELGFRVGFHFIYWLIF